MKITTTMSAKGRITIPKEIRNVLKLAPGDSVDFDVSREGKVVLRRAGMRPSVERDCFESARGKAQVKWRTDDLMALLRGID